MSGSSEHSTYNWTSEPSLMEKRIMDLVAMPLAPLADKTLGSLRKKRVEATMIVICFPYSKLFASHFNSEHK